MFSQLFLKEKKTKGSVLQVTEQEPRLATGPGPGGPSLECSVLVELQSEFHTDYASWCSVVPSVTFKLILPLVFSQGLFQVTEQHEFFATAAKDGASDLCERAY